MLVEDQSVWSLFLCCCWGCSCHLHCPWFVVHCCGHQGHGECVGIAFQSMNADEAENIGYVIPSLVVTHFLNLGSMGNLHFKGPNDIQWNPMKIDGLSWAKPVQAQERLAEAPKVHWLSDFRSWNTNNGVAWQLQCSLLSNLSFHHG